MIQVSDEIKAYIGRDSRTFYARIYDLTKEKYLSGEIRSLKIDKGSSDNSSLQPGAIFSNSISATIDYCEDSFNGDKLRVEIGVEIEGEVVYTPIATVFASNPSKKRQTTTVDAYGVISSKLGKKFNYSNLSTVSDLLRHIGNVANCEITLADGLSDLSIPSVNLSQYMYREVLGYVAGLYFGYATETVDGNIVIDKYKKSIRDSISSSTSRMLEHPEIEDEVEVKGVHINGSDDIEFSVGEVQNCDISNPMITQTAWDTYKGNFVGFKYKPYNASLTLGDFTIEPGDEIVLDGESYVCINLSHEFDGGLSTSISSPSLDDGENFYRGVTGVKSDIAYDNRNGGDGTSISHTYKIFKISGDGINSDNSYLWIEDGMHCYLTAYIQLSKGEVVTVRSGYTMPMGEQDENGDNSVYFGMDSSKNLNINGIDENLSIKGIITELTKCFTIPLYDDADDSSEGALMVKAVLNTETAKLNLTYRYTTNYMLNTEGTIAVKDPLTEIYTSEKDAYFCLQMDWITNAVIDRFG